MISASSILAKLKTAEEKKVSQPIGDPVGERDAPIIDPSTTAKLGPKNRVQTLAGAYMHPNIYEHEAHGP